MVTYKVVLDKRRKKNDGSYCVLVRITENRRVNTITSGINIEDGYWDENLCKVKSTHPNYKLLNQSITEWYLKIQKAVLQLEGEDAFTFDALKERLANNEKPRTVKKENYFNDFAKQLINDMFDANQTGNATIYKTSVNRLLGFINHRKLKFIELDYVLLESFRISLTKEGVKPNSISNYFRTLRAIYNRAIKAKFVDRSHYPFRDVVIKTEKTAKRAIRTDDFKAIINTSVKLKYSAKRSRDYGLLCFALRGVSFTDLAYLKHENIKNGVLTYRRKKTNQQLTIRLLPIVIELLDKYKSDYSCYLLPVLPSNVIENGRDAKRLIGQWIKTTNKWLQHIAVEQDLVVEISTYVIRHTWATTAKRLGFSNELIAESMGHEYGNKITNIYLDNFEQSVIDELNEKVVALITI